MKQKVTCLICDDEYLSRKNIKAALSLWRNWEVLSEAESAKGLLDSLDEFRPDVIFLDIRMPGKTGIDVSAEILSKDSPPEIIFITAFDKYAIQAFELYALDYLLKPFDKQRFAQSIHRAEKALTHKRINGGDHETVRPGRRYLKRLFIPSISKIQLVDIDDVYGFVASGNYVDVLLKDAKLLHRSSISQLEKNLDPRLFIRCHRSCIVRMDRIRDLQFLGDIKYEIVLSNGDKVKMSKTYRDSIMQALELDAWVY